jgi:hypothetical protein
MDRKIFKVIFIYIFKNASEIIYLVNLIKKNINEINVL